MNLFRRKKADHQLEFIDVSRMAYHQLPIQLAKDVPIAAKDFQRQKTGKVDFLSCPGMADYAKLGYIIPAWVDINIMANAEGTFARIGSEQRGTRGFEAPTHMSSSVVDGFIDTVDTPFAVTKVPSPWHIFGSKGVSALLLPAYYHSSFLEDLHVWGGSVDYEKFSVTNFIFSAKRKCNIRIKAGEPLLHVIPFVSQDMVCKYGPASEHQLDFTKNIIPGDDKQYYRKYQMVKKFFSLIRGSEPK